MEWPNKQNNVDVIDAADINLIANQVIANESAIANKEDIPEVENISDNSATGANACSLADIENTLRHYTSGSFSAIEFSIPNTEYPWTYLAEVSFISPATPTQVSYSAAKIINWVGTDCSVSGTYSIFAPVANKHYDIIFYFNGSQFIGLVNGYVPAGGNS